MLFLLGLILGLLYLDIDGKITYNKSYTHRRKRNDD